MTTDTFLETLSAQCDNFRTQLIVATRELTELNRRLTQIEQQLRKNIDVRDNSFADDFNAYCLQLRHKLDEQETACLNIRTQARTFKSNDWTADQILPAKGVNSRAKTLSRACDEFVTSYDIFARTYKGFTAAKLNVWLLTACQSDASSLTGKFLFLAREIAKQTELKRGKNVAG